jgi:hypothetical protein
MYNSIRETMLLMQETQAGQTVQCLSASPRRATALLSAMRTEVSIATCEIYCEEKTSLLSGKQETICTQVETLGQKKQRENESNQCAISQKPQKEVVAKAQCDLYAIVYCDVEEKESRQGQKGTSALEGNASSRHKSQPQPEARKEARERRTSHWARNILSLRAPEKTMLYLSQDAPRKISSRSHHTFVSRWQRLDFKYSANLPTLQYGERRPLARTVRHF